MGMTVVIGSRYLRGFVGDQDADTTWLDEKVQGWTELVRALLGVARKNPQSAYFVMQNSLQKEWEFMQQATPDIGVNFEKVEKAIRDSFLLALFQGVGEGIPVQGVTCLTSKQVVLALLYPTLTTH